MSGFSVGPEKEVPLSKRHPPYKANLRHAEGVALQEGDYPYFWESLL